MSVPTIIDTLCEISGQLHGIHSSIKRQTEILVTMRDEPKEAAPAPKGITWQEAAETLRNLCRSKTVSECSTPRCPMWSFCAQHLRRGGTPDGWEVPGDE